MNAPVTQNDAVAQLELLMKATTESNQKCKLDFESLQLPEKASNNNIIGSIKMCKQQERHLLPKKDAIKELQKLRVEYANEQYRKLRAPWLDVLSAKQSMATIRRNEQTRAFRGKQTTTLHKRPPPQSPNYGYDSDSSLSSANSYSSASSSSYEGDYN